ncbi:uncharacterized protein [Amphiura filiformis]|uniref:uncharacterized protein n=1 Tax=Amphiura filiformis TaxID=82378 RepID=UPI003B2101E4
MTHPSLLSKKNPFARDESGNTALMHAVRADNVESVRTLVTWKPPAGSPNKVIVDLGDNEGMFPLLLAAKQQNPDICEILMRDGDAPYDDIPSQWKKYLPPEYRGGKRKPLTNDPFEKYRHQAQDILKTTFRPPMALNIDPDELEEIPNDVMSDREGEETSKEADETGNSLENKSDKFYPWMSAMAVTRYMKKMNKDNKNQNNSDVSDETAVAVGVGASGKENGQSRPGSESSGDKPEATNTSGDENRTESPNKEKQDSNNRPKSTESKRGMDKEADPDKNDSAKSSQDDDPKKKKESEVPQDQDNQDKQRGKDGKENGDPKEQNPTEEQTKSNEDNPKNANDTGKELDKAKSKEENPKEADEKAKAKEAEKTKGKGGWVDQPEEVGEKEPEPPPMPAPPQKRNKRTGAYKTKGGRVIYPNAQNDPQYQKILDSKNGGGATGSGPGNNSKRQGHGKR